MHASRSVSLVLVMAALAACSGTAVVTLTSSASPDNFLAYRVGLISVQMQGSGGKSGLSVLQAGTIADLAALTDVSEVLGAVAVARGTYTAALITLDYSSAWIVYDDGSVNGVTLTPVGPNGRPLGQVQLKVTLDPGEPLSVTAKGTSRLALNFNLAASNIVNLADKTVSVSPMIAASIMPIDAKPVRIRGPLEGVAATSGLGGAAFTMGIMPFNGMIRGEGQLPIVPSDTTTYEVNGIASTGNVGLSQLAVSGGALAVAYGALVGTDQTATATAADGTQSTTSPATVTFAATQVLAGSSVQDSRLDRVSGTVSARSGTLLSIEDATLVGADGTDTFIGGTTIVLLGPNTLTTVFGQGGTAIDNTLEVSVGSSVDAFGVASQSSGNAALDASAGQVRINNTTASGLVTGRGAGLTLHLAFLGGRNVAPLNFAGSGASAGQYSVDTGALDLTNSAPGAPVVVTGLTSSFGAAPPNFSASALLDPTTIEAEIAVDWGAGAAAPFSSFDASSIDVSIRNLSIGRRHQIQVGAQTIDVAGLSSDPLIVPNSTSAAAIFTIGHAASSTMESFDTYAAFIAQVQSELNGATLATGLTATGQYAGSTLTLTADSITLVLND